jgi:thiol:disulfide interchange protein
MKLLQEMNVRGLPTLIFIDSKGEEVARLVGPQSSDAVIKTARRAMGN